MTVTGGRCNGFYFTIIEISFLAICLLLYLVQPPPGNIGNIKFLGCTFVPWSRKDHRSLNQGCTICGRTWN